MSHDDQRATLAGYFRTVLARIAARQKSKLDYDFPLMQSDFDSILDEWLG